jgi:hypothetical protein
MGRKEEEKREQNFGELYIPQKKTIQLDGIICREDL